MFRIISFTIHKHPLLGAKTFDLTNPNEDNSDNYYSVIIGPNGTGKSYLLNCLIEAFNEIALQKVNTDYRPKRKFTLTYTLDGIVFRVSTENREAIFEKNNFPTSITNIKLPSKWLACSVTINDKYPILNYVRKKQIPQYQYLGIRSASNNAFISRITINIVLYLIDALRKEKSGKLLEVYKALSLKPELQIIFIGGPMLKLEKKEGEYYMYKTSAKMTDPHNTFIKKNKSKTNYRADNYKKHLDNNKSIEKVFSYMTSYKSTFQKKSKAGIQLKYELNLADGSGIQKLLEEWSVLSIMLDLELIKINKFLITKDSTFKYEEASSGESHLLTSLHGILANVEENSLVIIDEPEVSLHPNWQIEYLDILKSLIGNTKGVNIIISTHSNLLVSSLKNEESRITSIRREKETGAIEIDELDFETYGWDPESILYNVFEVATLRNKYFELDLRKLVALITTKSNDKNEVKRLRDKVGKYILTSENDPLKLLIEEVDKFLSN